MTVVDFLVALKDQGVELHLEPPDQLRIKARKGAMTDALREQIVQRKPELLAFLQQAQQLAGSARRVIAKAPPDAEGVLSFAQERLWFLDRLEPDNTAYSVPLAIRFQGDLRLDLLQASLDALVARHESLRTRFDAYEPRQVIDPAEALPIAHQDLSELPRERREGACRSAIQLECRRPFSLPQGPLLRAVLYRLDQRDHVLLLNHHHIITDGWSIGILTREFAQCYSALAQGQQPALSPLTIQYRDFAHWQRHADPARLEQGLLAWERLLAGAPSHLDLPLDGPRPAVQTQNGGQLDFAVPSDTVRALDALASRLSATRAMLAMTALGLVLCRYSGQIEVCIGMPVANRPDRQLEDLIGFFVNTLVMRVRAEASASFAALATTTRAYSLEAFDLQDIPFEQVVERLHPERDLARTPLFQVMFNEVKSSLIGTASGATLPNLVVTPFDLQFEHVKFELSLAITSDQDHMGASLSYNRDLFHNGAMARLCHHWLVFLAAACRQPEAPLAQLALIDDQERHQLLEGWNRTQTPIAEPPLLHQGFEAWAARTPQRLALCWGERQLTYGELLAQAHSLAQRLLAWGIGPENTVGLVMPRCPELIIAQLAVLAAGAAYVPLDPTYPQERLAFIIADSRLSALIGQPQTLALLPDNSLPAYTFGQTDDQLSTCAPPPTRATPQNLAYLIYTSGSTGRPKGVAIAHASAVALVAWSRLVFSDADLRGTLASTSINFDLSIFEIFVTLARGGTLILVENALALAEARQPVTLINTVPSAARELLAADAIPTSVAVVNLAGEPLPQRLAQGLYALPHVRAVFNLYGPSEDTTYSTFALVPRPCEAPPTIGAPIANSQLYLLDRQGQLCPLGIPGEVALAGLGLARGYFDRPALTAEKFVPNSFSLHPGSRLYLCGDLARHRADASPELMNLNFLGRIDRQIKIRGFRIELGEIERAILRCPGVAEAAVKVWGGGDPYLAAYLAASATFDLTSLQTHLACQLPAYMVPSRFVVLAALPMTPNGKIDRKALAEPSLEDLPRTEEAPLLDPAALVLRDLWAAVLDREPTTIAANASFFNLGGHSLSVARLIGLVRRTFNLELPLRQVFAEPTLAAMARALRQTRGETTLAMAGPTAVPRDGAVPLSFAQQRLFFLYRLEGPSPIYNIPGQLPLHQPLAAQALERAFNALTARHESLRTLFLLQQGQAFQLITPARERSLPLIDLSGLTPARQSALVAALAARDAAKPFLLESGPLCRLTLLRLAPDHQTLLWNMHHIIADAWSIEIFNRELVQLYRAALLNPERLGHTLPALPLQYPDFALWQRQWLAGPTLDQQLAFWTQTLAGAPPSLDLPTRAARPALQSYRGASYEFALGSATSRRLAELARATQATPFILIQAVFAEILGRLASSEEVVLGSPIANRRFAELEGLIGLFVNTLVLRHRLVPATVQARIHATRDTLLAAYAHQDLPFEKLVEALSPTRDLSRSPLFQAFVNYQAGTLPITEQRDQAILAFQDQTLAKFELSLTLAETPAGLIGTFEFNRDLFEQATARRWLGYFLTLTEACLDQPAAPIQRLSMLAADERAWLCQVAAGADLAPVPLLGLDEGFRRQARRTPAAPALCHGSASLSYRELDLRVDALAAQLWLRGMRCEHRVAVLLRREPDLLVCLLAVLRCGAAYVPLDPNYPADRLTFMLADSDACLLLSRSELLDRLELPADLPQLLLDQAATPAPTPVYAGYPPERLAYLIYTSGSTGRPKAVAIAEHAAAVLLAWARSLYAPADLAHVLAGTSVCFDLSIFELFLPLSVGGAVHLADNALALYQLVDADQITLVNTVPSVAADYLRQGPLPTGVKVMNLAGELLPQNLVDDLYRNPQLERLYDLYGPSEDTTYSTYVLRRPGGQASIGRPLTGTRAYVLDRWLNLVSRDAAGELALAGLGLARGYLGRPALTASRFVPDPFANEPGQRLYLTGDLARHLDDGALRLLGRIDHQVKLRGLRIELGELENLLLRHPQIREAAVIVDAQAQQLCAFVVATSPLETQDLRRHLAVSLPETMIPTRWFFHQTLPLTANRKLDRKALLALSADAPSHQSAILAPQSELEHQIRAIWARVLQCEPETIGVDQSFFSLGGHSILAISMLASLNRELSLDLPLAHLFAQPTIAAIASAAAPRDADHPNWIVPLRSAPQGQALFLVHPIGGSVAAYLALADRLNRPVWAIQSPGLEAEAPALTTLESLATRYLTQIRGVQPEGPYHLGGWSFGGLIALELARQLERAGQACRITMIDTGFVNQPTPPTDRDLLRGFAIDLLSQAGVDPETMARSFAAVGEPTDPLATLAQIVARDRLLPAEFDGARLQRLWQVYRSHALAGCAYRPSVQSTPTVFVRARETQTTEAWSQYLVHMTTLVLDGHHFNLLQGTNLDRIAELFIREDRAVL